MQSSHLLNAKPGLMSLNLLHHISACCTSVGGNGLHGCQSAVGQQPRGLIGITHHQNVVTTPERILEDRPGNQVNLRVIARSLASG